MPYPDSDYERSWKMQTKGVMLYPATMQRLIEAAPELLALAKWVRDNMEPLGKDPCDGVNGWRHMDATEVDSIVSGVLHFCDEAIAKAEGRSE